MEWGLNSLALQAGITPAEAKELLRLHKDTYRTFWRWSEDIVSGAMVNNEMKTVFGWRRKLGQQPNPRSLMNFPDASQWRRNDAHCSDCCNGARNRGMCSSS